MSYRGLATFLRALMMVTTRRNWRGAENFPSSGGFVVCPNHISYVDPFAFAHFLYDNGHPPFFLAKSEVFRIPILGRLLKAAQQIPVYRGTDQAAEAFSAAVAAVQDGKCVPIFPEGTLTRDPQMWPMTARTGAARVALTTRCPVIPVAQWGRRDSAAVHQGAAPVPAQDHDDGGRTECGPSGPLRLTPGCQDPDRGNRTDPGRRDPTARDHPG